MNVTELRPGNYFTEEVDAVCHVTSDEMEQLNRKLYSNKVKWTKY